VEADLYTWAALLRTYGKAKDVDGAYQVWLQVQVRSPSEKAGMTHVLGDFSAKSSYLGTQY
jgi:pentatricopeptide repeat protein